MEPTQKSSPSANVVNEPEAELSEPEMPPPPPVTSTLMPPSSNDPQNDNEPQAGPSDIRALTTTPVAKKKKPSSEYTYTPLMEISSLLFKNTYPVHGSTIQSIVCHVHGIIVQYQADTNKVTLMDESHEHLTALIINTLPRGQTLKKNGMRLPASWTNSSREFTKNWLPIRTGDILRIHRLTLTKDHFEGRSFKVSDLVVFESLKDTLVSPLHFSTNPTISENDTKRVLELQQLQANALLSNKFSLVKDDGRKVLYKIINLAAQVLAVRSLPNRHILACWNGKPIEGSPSYCAFDLDSIIYSISQFPKAHYYTPEYIKRLYDKGHIIFVTVFGGEHQIVTERLQALDTVILYNIVTKPSDFHFGRFSYLIYSKNKYGRTIRLAEPQSILHKQLHDQIQASFLEDNAISNIENTPDNFAQLLDDDDDEALLELTSAMSPPKKNSL